jgi:hypothetical protein
LPLGGSLLRAQYQFRDVHAAQAVSLATQQFLKFKIGAGPAEPIYLLDNHRLREELGRIIGQVAHSHHWSAEKVAHVFTDKIHPAPAAYPDWNIDVLKIALLLRISDAAQIDSRRAPTFALALRSPAGTSYLHWNFLTLPDCRLAVSEAHQ